MEPSPPIVLYIDGACLGNPGPGGYAAVALLEDRGPHTCTGREEWTTNNRMELTAAVVALENLPAGMDIVVRTDSSYVADGFARWVPRWRRNGWRTRSGAVANQDLWKQLVVAVDRHTVVLFERVRGHSGVAWNEFVDGLASAEANAARSASTSDAVSSGFPALEPGVGTPADPVHGHVPTLF